MAASSLSYLTLSSHHYPNKTPKFPKPPNFLISPPSIFHHPRLRQPVSKSHIPSVPISKHPIIVSRNKIPNFFVEKIATVLLGSLVFVGCLKPRPVLAQHVQQSEISEEVSDSQFKKSLESEVVEEEDEVMCVKLLQENPRNIDALKMAVNVKMKKGKTGEAVEYVEKLIELQSNEMEWRLLQALCYETLGDFIKAKSLFKNILKQKPLLLRALHVQ
ncbi:hypothetical protein OROGR_019017 [Orobanche gracilis]